MEHFVFLYLSCLTRCNVDGPTKNFCATAGHAHIGGLALTPSCDKMHIQHVATRRLHLHRCVTLATPLLLNHILPLIHAAVGR